MDVHQKLHCAINLGDTDEVASLLDQNADPHQKATPPFTFSPLGKAALSGKADNVELLLSRASYSDHEIIRILYDLNSPLRQNHSKKDFKRIKSLLKESIRNPEEYRGTPIGSILESIS